MQESEDGVEIGWHILKKSDRSRKRLIDRTFKEVERERVLIRKTLSAEKRLTSSIR